MLVATVDRNYVYDLDIVTPELSDGATSVIVTEFGPHVTSEVTVGESNVVPSFVLIYN